MKSLVTLLGVALALPSAAVSAAALQASPVLDYLELDELSPHHRLSVHGKNLDQGGQIHVGGQPALVVPIQGTNPVQMNAYVPASVPFGPQPVTVTTAGGTSNALTLNVVPRVPDGRVLWRFFMNNQVMLHRPAIGADGTIYAKSQAGDLIAISPQGELKWLLQLEVDLQSTIDIGPDGTIYTGGGATTVFAVNPDGTIKWTFVDPLPTQGAIAGPNVGPDGNVYVATHLPGSGIISLDPSGAVRWTGPDNPYSPLGELGEEIVFSSTQLFFCLWGVFDSFTFDGGHVFRATTVTSSSSDSPQPAVGPNGDAYVEEWAQLRSHASDGSLNWKAFGAGGNWLRMPDVGPDGSIYVVRNVFNTFHALNPDGSERWMYNDPLPLLNPVMDPTGGTIVVGGGKYGDAFYKGLDAGGAPRWKVKLPVEQFTPFDVAQAFPQGRARFTPDGSVAYVMASGPAHSGGHCYLYALQVGTAVDVGHGMQGAAGVPKLSTVGTLEPGTTLTAKLADAKPGALTYVVAGWSVAGVPFLHGVLVPTPDIAAPLATDGSGKLEVSVIWPAGLAAETQLLLQCWVQDAAGPDGWVASNAVSLITK
jgi:hypothetical protein